jgi:hypothetical protein
VHRLEQRDPPRVDIARRGQAQAAAQRSPQIGQDVAKQVAGHHHVEALRGAHELHRRNIDVQVTGGDAGRSGLGSDLLKDALPQAMGVRQGVGLIDHADARPLRALSSSRQGGHGEGGADDALDTAAGV